LKNFWNSQHCFISEHSSALGLPSMLIFTPKCHMALWGLVLLRILGFYCGCDYMLGVSGEALANVGIAIFIICKVEV